MDCTFAWTTLCHQNTGFHRYKFYAAVGALQNSEGSECKGIPYAVPAGIKHTIFLPQTLFIPYFNKNAQFDPVIGRHHK